MITVSYGKFAVFAGGKMGAPKGNRNRAIKNKYVGRVVSLSGPKYDAAIDCLKEKGIENPSNKEVLEAMDWGQFGFNLSDEEASGVEREAEMRKLRADYRWIKDCERLSIESLKEVVSGSEEDYQNPLNLKRHRQAQIVLEARER